uniref:Uncharacterized protein n=1 Tax=Anguilla anguilla TaxID=7936 RepID=A0A0E9QTD9_ANGAN
MTMSNHDRTSSFIYVLFVCTNMCIGSDVAR